MTDLAVRVANKINRSQGRPQKTYVLRMLFSFEFYAKTYLLSFLLAQHTDGSKCHI